MQINAAYHQLCSELGQRYPAGEARSIARIVFEDAFDIRNFGRTDELSSQQIVSLDSFRQRLLNGEPVQYVMEKAFFYGYYFTVEAGVLIPRAETEELVHWVLQTRLGGKSVEILDIGSGSGCIPISIKLNWPEAILTAVDLSEKALTIGKANAKQLKAKVDFRKLDILNESEWKKLEKFDLIVSNPPYIPFSEMDLMPVSVLEFEPPLALFVQNNDPLIFYRKIAGFGKHHLKKSGHLFLECNEFNAEEVVRLLQNYEYKNIEIRKDMQGKDRMIRAEK